MLLDCFFGFAKHRSVSRRANPANVLLFDNGSGKYRGCGRHAAEEQFRRSIPGLDAGENGWFMSERSRKLFGLSVITLAAGSAWANQAIGASIGINFVGGGGALASGDVAGVVPEDNYNNATGITGTDITLNSDMGTPTGAELTYSAASAWSAGTFDTGTDANSRMFYGYADADSSGPQSTFELSGVTYATYDVYIYISSDHPNDGRSDTITDGSTTISNITVNSYDPNPSDNPHGFIQAVNNNTSGNYEMFSETSSTVTFTVGRFNGFGIAGMQIVDTAAPEPATLSMLGVAAAGLLLRRRKA
jgi:hypothetical protein